MEIDYWKIISFILLFISILFNFKEWAYDYYFFGYKLFSETINIEPSLISTLIALFLFGGYILRNKNEILNDGVKIAFCLADLIFFSGFISMFSNRQTNVLGVVLNQFYL